MPSDMFATIADRVPSAHKTLIETQAGRRISYGEAMAASGRFANALASFGVKPGDRVAMQTPKSPEAIFLYLACLRAGAVLLPLNSAYTLSELEYFISDAEPALVVCDPGQSSGVGKIVSQRGAGVAATLDGAGEGSLGLRAMAQAKTFASVSSAPDDLAAMLYTSGTTGRPKGAMLTHENLRSNAEALVATWRFTADDVLIHALPIYHTHGLFVATNVALFSGASMLFMPKFDAAEVLRAMPRATAMMGVPTFYVRLLRDPDLTREAAKHMRLFISGSAPLLAETHREWQARTGHAILERYGMTETGMNTSNPYSGDRIAGTVGLPLAGVTVRVVDPDTAEPLPRGQVGMIEVKGPNVFAGYWRNPEKTRAEFRADGFFITGDLGKVDGRGYVHIVGRGKDLVISGGFNVYPKEVENEIDALPGVAESAVIGLPHKDFGEGVTAIVVAEPGARLSEAALLEGLDGQLAKFKMPKRVVLVDDLPRNAMGKVQKNVLRETYRKLYE